VNNKSNYTFTFKNSLVRIGICFLPATLSYAESTDDNRPTNLPSTSEKQEQEIHQLKADVSKLQEQLDEISYSENSNETETSRLQLGGFFDIHARTSANDGKPFSLGGLELGIQYDQVENFSVSAALVWSDDTAEIAVAVIDYHANNSNVPTRGRLFGEPGYHIQLGRFDIPFGVDYEYFAATDRPNISSPMTTERVQNDGLNGDGLRVYGSWEEFDYAAYWVNSLFEDSGTSVGGRLGYFPGRDPYQIHNKEEQSNLIVGLSWLQDLDKDNNDRKSLYGIDLNFNYSNMTFILEYMYSDNDELIFLDNGTFAGEDYEKGYNARLLFHLKDLTLFLSYGEWKPKYWYVIDDEDSSINYRVENIDRITIGINYPVTENVLIKMEYLTHLDTLTEEPGFEKDRLTFQMVTSF